MIDNFSNAQEWITVFGYLGFTLFVAWCVFATKKK